MSSLPRGATLLALLAVACGAPARPSEEPPSRIAQAPPPRRVEPPPPREVPAPAPEPSAPALEVRRGRASYYSDRFTGRPTASGERYDPRALTAASRDLPFGTRVRVVREDTGESVIVRVNDRGPFRDRRRILDLSRAAAERLGMIRAGVVDIRAEIIERP